MKILFRLFLSIFLTLFIGSAYATDCNQVCGNVMNAILKYCDSQQGADKDICYKSAIYPQAGVYSSCKSACEKLGK